MMRRTVTEQGSSQFYRFRLALVIFAARLLLKPN
jgi:hypothetical protein